MNNYTEEQIKRIEREYDLISGEGLTKEEIIEMYGAENVEFEETEENEIETNEIENVSIEDKIEELIQYYDCAGVKTEQDLFRFLGI